MLKDGLVLLRIECHVHVDFLAVVDEQRWLMNVLSRSALAMQYIILCEKSLVIASFVERMHAVVNRLSMCNFRHCIVLRHVTYQQIEEHGLQLIYKYLLQIRSCRKLSTLTLDGKPSRPGQAVRSKDSSLKGHVAWASRLKCREGVLQTANS